MQNNIIYFLVLLLVIVILFDGNNAEAQQRLSPEQEETVKQLKEQLLKDGNACFIRNSKMDRTRAVEEQFKDIDPILVGQNVVFGKNWLKHIGQNAHLSRQQFEQWRRTTDEVYDCYVKLTGGPPNYGKIIFIDVYHDAHGAAHADRYGVCYNEQLVERSLAKEVQIGSSGAMFHELGHVFSFGKDWEIEVEVAAHFLHFYGLENTGIWYIWGQRVSGTMSRREHTERAWSHYRESKKNNTKIPTISNGYWNDAYCCLLTGLVNKVGWEPVEHAIQSYKDKPGDYTGIAREDRQQAQARDFLERIAQFSGVPNVLRSLLDKGELWDEHFTPPYRRITWDMIMTETVEEILLGWSIKNCGHDMEPGKRANYRSRKNIFVTHPMNQQTPCSLEHRGDIPATGKTVLKAVVSNHPGHDWELVCCVNGSVQKTVTVNEKLTKNGWATVTFDLTPFADNNVLIELQNRANGWSYEAGYWASLTIESEVTQNTAKTALPTTPPQPAPVTPPMPASQNSGWSGWYQKMLDDGRRNH